MFGGGSCVLEGRHLNAWSSMCQDRNKGGRVAGISHLWVLEAWLPDEGPGVETAEFCLHHSNSGKSVHMTIKIS